MHTVVFTHALLPWVVWTIRIFPFHLLLMYICFSFSKMSKYQSCILEFLRCCAAYVTAGKESPAILTTVLLTCSELGPSIESFILVSHTACIVEEVKCHRGPAISMCVLKNFAKACPWNIPLKCVHTHINTHIASSKSSSVFSRMTKLFLAEFKITRCAQWWL